METLYTERLILQPLRETDADEAWPHVDEAGMWTYFPRLRPRTLDQLRAQWGKWERGSLEQTEIWLNWACRDRTSKNLLGTMQSTVFPKRHEALIAYAVYRRYQGNGFAREACKAIISHLRERYEVNRIHAEMSTRNIASYRLAESLGFKRIETRRTVDLGGLVGDEYLYELVT